MPRHVSLARLTDALTELYPQGKDARRLAMEVGLALDRVIARGPGVATWHSILEEAERAGKTEALIEAALASGEERGLGSQTLAVRAAAQHYRRWLAAAQADAGQALVACGVATDAREAALAVSALRGREAELDELLSAVEHGGAQVCGVRGADGAGKTALALALARRLHRHYPDGQLFIDLGGANEQALRPAQAMAQVIRAYYPEAKLPEDEEDLRGFYRSALDGQRVLLILDNARDRAQVAPLVPAPGSMVIVTSRERFSLPGLFALNLGPLQEQDAAALLCALAPRLAGEAVTSPGAGASGQTPLQLARLCGGLPLALRIAAGTLAGRGNLSTSRYARRLEALRARRPEVEAVLSLCESLLPRDLRARWQALAVFPADWDARAAAAVWHVDEEPARQTLHKLWRDHLLEVVPPEVSVGSDLVGDEIPGSVPREGEESDEEKGAPAATRYRLHDLLRDYALAGLDAEEALRSRGLHAAHYQQILREANDLFLRGGAEMRRGLALYDLERANIEAGQAFYASRAVESDLAARGCSNYPVTGAAILDLRLPPHRLIHWLQDARKAASLLGDLTQEWAHLHSLGLKFIDLGEFGNAVECYQTSFAIAREIKDRVAEGASLNNLGGIYAHMRDPQRAVVYLEQWLVIARETRDRRGEASALANLANTYHNLHETARAVECSEEALRILRELGDRRAEGAVLNTLGVAHIDLGEIRQAIGYFEQWLDIARELGDTRAEGGALSNLGAAYQRMGNLDRAVHLRERALILLRDMGDRPAEGRALAGLANAYYALGERRRAVEAARQYLAIVRLSGDRRAEGVVLMLIGGILGEQGQVDEAIPILEEATAILEGLEDPKGRAARDTLRALRWEVFKRDATAN